MKWELIKAYVISTSINWSLSYTKEKNRILCNLKDQLNKLQGKRIELLESAQPECITQHRIVKKEIEQHVLYITEGKIFRSKIKWYNQGKKSSTYFYNL